MQSQGTTSLLTFGKTKVMIFNVMPWSTKTTGGDGYTQSSFQHEGMRDTTCGVGVHSGAQDSSKRACGKNTSIKMARHREEVVHRQWICGPLNKAIKQGLPTDWQKIWVKALYKKGDANQPTNYRTIMVGSCMSKLLGSILELLHVKRKLCLSYSIFLSNLFNPWWTFCDDWQVGQCWLGWWWISDMQKPWGYLLNMCFLCFASINRSF